MTATNGCPNTRVAFKNCAPYTRCVTHINDERIETSESLDIVMNMYNFIEYSVNYGDTSGTLYHIKSDEQDMNNANLADLTDASTSFKYKSSILGSPIADSGNGVLKNAKKVVPLKYLSKITIYLLYILAFDYVNIGANKVERDSHRKYSLPNVNTTNKI